MNIKIHYIMKNFYKIFLVLFIFLLSCEKEEEPAITVFVTLNKDAIEFLKVTPGKYLIYKDSATSETDSIVITTCTTSQTYYNKVVSNNFFIPDTPAYSGENFVITYTKKTDSNLSSIWFNGLAKAYYQHNAPLTNLPLKLVDYIENYTVYGGSLYYDENTIPLPSFNVDGITYSNVIAHNTDSGLEITHPNYLKTEYYWAKGIGIIQKSIERTNGIRKTHYLIRRN